MDVTSLYTNIPQEEGITTVWKAYEDFYSPFLRWAGEWVESVNAKHGGADLGDAIIWDEHKCDQKRYG